MDKIDIHLLMQKVKEFIKKEKARVVAVGLICLLILACFVFSRPSKDTTFDIDEGGVPLAVNNEQDAHYFIMIDEKTSHDYFGSLLKSKYIGDGSFLYRNGEYTYNPPSLTGTLYEGCTIEWSRVIFSSGNYRVIGKVIKGPELEDRFVVEQEEIEGNLVFDTKADMVNAELESGSEVEVLGYSTKGDGGAAKYRIIDTAASKADGLFIEALKNGKYAELIVPSDGLISVALYGIFPNSEISDRLNKLIEMSCNKVSGLRFESGDYIVDKPVVLKSLSYYGSDGTWFIVSPHFDTYDDKIFLTSPNSRDSIELVNLGFLYETSANHPLANKETILVALQETESCRIDSCTFISRPAAQNPGFMRTDLLWFKHSAVTKDITIKNSVFENHTGEAYTGSVTDYIAGGCLWACGKYDDFSGIISNIVVDNCVIYNSTSDEAVAVWKGNVSNVVIKNSTISCNYHNSDNLISFFNGSFNNCVIDRCRLESNSPCKYLVKHNTYINQSDFSLLNNEIYLNAGGLSTNDALGVLNITGNGADESGRTRVEMSGNTIDAPDGVSLKVVLRSKSTMGNSIAFNNNLIRGRFDYGLLLFEDTKNVTIAGSNNSIQTNTTMGSIKNSYDNSIEFRDNEIWNKVTITISESGNMDYYLLENTLRGDYSGYVFTANKLSESNAKSNIIVKDNKMAEGGSLDMFYSNNGVQEQHLANIVTE